jgi:radical SAM-linked protein
VRIRVRFQKLGKVRFTSHRDLARIWERATRRAELPIAYSVGFTPRPKLSFGLALSTGHESLAEYLDIELDENAGSAGGALFDLVGLPERLSSVLPWGIDVSAAAEIPAGTMSLQQSVLTCEWEIGLHGVDVAAVAAAVESVLRADAIQVTRERKGRPVDDDIRPGVVDLSIRRSTADEVVLWAELGAQPRALRPAELLAAMDLRDHEGLVRRTKQWMNDGQHRREPLAADAARRLPADGDALRRDELHVRHTGRPDPDCSADDFGALDNRDHPAAFAAASPADR